MHPILFLEVQNRTGSKMQIDKLQDWYSNFVVTLLSQTCKVFVMHTDKQLTPYKVIDYWAWQVKYETVIIWKILHGPKTKYKNRKTARLRNIGSVPPQFLLAFT